MADLHHAFVRLLEEEPPRHTWTAAEQIRQKGHDRRRNSWIVGTLTTTFVVLVLLAIATTFAPGHGTTSPMSPGPVVPSVPPSPTDWSALQGRDTSIVDPGGAWKDPVDTPVEGVDLTRVKRDYSYRAWKLGLAAWPQVSDLKNGIVSTGVVVDSTHDGIADYLIGIDNDASPQPRGSDRGQINRVWVTDLATGETDLQDGGPYGFPFDFSHEPGKHGGPVSRHLIFLGEAPFPDAQHARWYAWSSLSRDGEILAWDTAPDTGWLYTD